ncbi:hypothetical protein ACHAW5_010677 [Stephanodiscus triporus]|uniref:Uncharacterized protein n=1 Tax=Stephanodiscus triporus TaxID=2934178 RepID=A0ABD3QTU5_9STRA
MAGHPPRSPRSRAGGPIGEEGYYRIDFLLQGALYKMVRNMVGTAMECWLGRLSEGQIVDMLRIDRDDDDDNDHVGRMGRKDNPCKARSSGGTDAGVRLLRRRILNDAREESIRTDFFWIMSILSKMYNQPL